MQLPLQRQLQLPSMPSTPECRPPQQRRSRPCQQIPSCGGPPRCPGPHAHSCTQAQGQEEEEEEGRHVPPTGSNTVAAAVVGSWGTGGAMLPSLCCCAKLCGVFVPVWAGMMKIGWLGLAYMTARGRRCHNPYRAALARPSVRVTHSHTLLANLRQFVTASLPLPRQAGSLPVAYTLACLQPAPSSARSRPIQMLAHVMSPVAHPAATASAIAQASAQAASSRPIPERRSRDPRHATPRRTHLHGPCVAPGAVAPGSVAPGPPKRGSLKPSSAQPSGTLSSCSC